MVPRKQTLMLSLCTGVMAVVRASGDPTTAPVQMAKDYLHRASGEIALINSSGEQNFVLTDWLYAKAAFDSPADVDQTIRLATNTFDPDEKPEKEGDTGITSKASLRSFQLCQLADSYAKNGNIPGAKKTLAWADLAIADIAKTNDWGRETELERVAKVRARIGDVDGAVAALMKIKHPQNRAECTNHVAEVAKAAGRPNDAKVFIGMAFKIWDQVTDTASQPRKDMARMDLLVTSGDFAGARQIIDKYPHTRFRSLAFLAIRQFEAGDTAGSAKTVSDYLASNEATDPLKATNVSYLANSLAKDGDQPGAMLCLRHAIDLASRPVPPDQAKQAADIQLGVQCDVVEVEAATGQIDAAKMTFASLKEFPFDALQFSLQESIRLAEMKAGRFAEAEADIAANGYHTNLFSYLGARLVRHGDFGGVESAVKSLPNPEDRAYVFIGAARGLASGSIDDLVL